MNGLLASLAALAIFIAAGLGVLVATITSLRLLGRALNRNRPLAQRRWLALGAAAAFLGVFGAAASGYVLILAVMFYAGR